jgi:predicted RND superfamily exporter protein
VDPVLPCYPRARPNLTATCSSNLEVDVIIYEAVRAIGEPDAKAAIPDALGFVSRCLIRGSLTLEVAETLFV